MDDNPSNLAIYIHWPYCSRICPYCDFNVYKARRDEGLVEAINKDLAYWRDWSGARNIISVHFGGGTPSLMPHTQINAVLENIDRLWGLQNNTEVAIEANPNDYRGQNWHDLRAVGVNRISLGVQSFQDYGLKLLGRDHDGRVAREALLAAVDIFPSSSADLIFGWAGQTIEMWESDLHITMDSGVPHVSTYQLTIEPGTAFAKMEARGDFKGQGETSNSELYDYSIEQLVRCGFDHYEVSNFARPGHRSQHNYAYWTAQDYAGVGPGAHGRLTLANRKYATVAALKPEDYVYSVDQSYSGIATKGCLTPLERAEEYVLMGLRISEGIDLNVFSELSGDQLNPEQIVTFIESKHLIRLGPRIAATSKGRKVLNYITEKLLT